jgi:hypothetical protein
MYLHTRGLVGAGPDRVSQARWRRARFATAHNRFGQRPSPPQGRTAIPVAITDSESARQSS